jgi:signal peptidase II
MRGWRGLLIAAGIVIADQVTKWLALALMPLERFVPVTPFFNLVLVWNPGISFGMFGSAPSWSRWVLIGLTLLISLALIIWLRRESRLLPQLAIWSILAGALGNLIDRVRFGAVVDFLDFHIGGYHWPAFNIADSAIVIGAALLVLDGFVLSRRTLGGAEEKV